MKRIFILLLLINVISANAQYSGMNLTGKISGRIIDSVSAQPIEYASISLVRQDSNKTVNGTTTDKKGTFKMTDVPDGTYKLMVYFIGYQTMEMKNIVVDKANPNIVFDDIKLVNKTTALKEVNITSEKSVIEYKIDKMVYHADQLVTAQTGVASDILKRVPEVSIDVDGNVELQGNSGIRFLIDGKPSVVFGNNIADVLQSIPASQIKSIEVITNPGAKYDAAGTGGIINIILKKSTAEGFNGNISLSGGTRLENGSVNLNVHHKHFGVSAFFSGNAQLPSTTINSMDRLSQNYAPMQFAELNQNGPSVFSRYGFQSGIDLDWDITTKDNITGSFGCNYYGNKNSGTTYRLSTLKDSIENIISNVNDIVNTSNYYHSLSPQWGLKYKHKFKKEDHELEISYNSSLSNSYLHYLQTQKYVTPDSVYSGSYGNNPGTEQETDFSIDYTQPLCGDVSLEAGGKAELSRIISTSDVYLLDVLSDDYLYSSDQSLSLNYKCNVYAGYASVKFRLLKWLDMKVGTRYEYTSPHAYFSNSGDIPIKSYGTYVPSLVLSHTFKKKQTLKITFNHRIERPDYRDLNPFINASDPKNLITGNPELRPELGDKVELGYNKTFDKGTVCSLTLFYRGNKDDIQSYTRYYSSFTVGDSVYTNVAVADRENVGREDNYGINLFVSVPLISKIIFRTNISGFQRYIINGALPGSNVQGFNYRINLNASYEISNSFIVEAFGNFNSPRTNTQGKMPAFITYNFALRKQFLHKKLSFAITATNPFNKYVNQKSELCGDNFTLTNIRELPYRSFGVNLTYKFGKLKFKKEKEIEDYKPKQSTDGKLIKYSKQLTANRKQKSCLAHLCLLYNVY